MGRHREAAGLSDAAIGYNPATDDGGPPPVKRKRPPELGPVPHEQVRAIELCDRIEAAAAEFRRQMLTDEPDTSFVPADVLRQLNRYVCDRADVTVAAVVGKAVTMLFRNFLNVEEVAPEVARLILPGRTVEPIGGAS
jgi:hypothetical protein